MQVPQVTHLVGNANVLMKGSGATQSAGSWPDVTSTAAIEVVFLLVERFQIVFFRPFAMVGDGDSAGLLVFQALHGFVVDEELAAVS